MAGRNLFADQPQAKGRDLLAPSVGPTVDAAKADTLAKMNQDLGGDQPSQGRSFAQGAADILSFGTSDEIAAFLGSLGGKLPGGHGKSYDELLPEVRAQQGMDAEGFPKTHLAGQGAGVVGSIVAGGPLTMTANAVRAGAPLTRVAGTSAVEGGLLGGAQGFGSGEGGFTERLKSTGLGAGVGAAVGGAAPLALAGLGAVSSPLVRPISSWINPQGGADRALNTVLQRSGQTPKTVADALRLAQADNQGMFNAADAIGNAGQRMLSTVAKSPSDARQPLVEALMQRQAGQGDRLTNTLSEAFGGPTTAKAVELAKETARKAEAGTLYDAARASAKPVNLSDTISTIDDLLKRDPILGETALTKTEIGNRLAGIRGKLTNGDQQLIDFDTVLNIKTEIGKQIKKGNTDLAPVYAKLDAALEGSSPDYRAANDAYKQASNVIASVDKGRKSASGANRAADTIPAFNALSPDEQAGFRSGYVDPQIAKIEASAGPLTNKARALQTDKTGMEYPAFAEPGQGPRLGSKIAREQTMFDTNRAALGGSETHQNIADAADMAGFDTGLITAFRHGTVNGIMNAVGTVVRNAQGNSAPVLDRVAKALLETRPDVVEKMFTDAANKGAVSAGRRAVMNALINNVSSSTAGRAPLPGTAP